MLQQGSHEPPLHLLRGLAQNGQCHAGVPEASGIVHRHHGQRRVLGIERHLARAGEPAGGQLFQDTLPRRFYLWQRYRHVFKDRLEGINRIFEFVGLGAYIPL